MSLWTNKERRTEFNDADTFANGPGGDKLKQWLVGAVIPFFIVFYGISCLSWDETVISSHDGSAVAYGTAASGLVIAFIALGLFLHFHFFWRLSERLEPYAERLKSVSLIVFLGGFLFAIFHRLGIF
jgi:hypothetical protein